MEIAAHNANVRQRGDLHEWLRGYWNDDSATYDCAPEHALQTPGQSAAWREILTRLLPPAPARVLDVGAGTGFLTIPLAELGYDVTAVDLSSGMLAKLRERVTRAGLEVEIVEGPAERPPDGPFDAVVERLLLWTLPDPVGALRAWRVAAPEGRLVCFGGVWGEAAGRVEGLKSHARERLRRLRRSPPEHHAPYAPEVLEQLPFGSGIAPDALADLVERAGWRQIRLERLRDAERAHALALSPLERPLGVVHEFGLVAEDAGEDA
jgi:SAM-dependent methyltransferase